MASAVNSGQFAVSSSALTLVTAPVESTINFIKTYPSILAFAHLFGYTKFSTIYSLNAVSPPLNVALCSTEHHTSVVSYFTFSWGLKLGEVCALTFTPQTTDRKTITTNTMENFMWRRYTEKSNPKVQPPKTNPQPPKTKQKKAPDYSEAFSRRSGRDSNPRPHA